MSESESKLSALPNNKRKQEEDSASEDEQPQKKTLKRHVDMLTFK